MAFFHFTKKKDEKAKTPACACSCGCPVPESAATDIATGCCSNSADGICCIKVLGAGCASCHTLYENTQAAARAEGLSAEVLYITDLQTVMGYGVMSLPALVVNDTVVSAGKVLKTGDVQKLLHKFALRR